jgi:hypothetical protein
MQNALVKGRGTKQMNIYQDAANNAKEGQADEFSGRRLWTAVLLQAIEDWKSSNARRRSEAERFFFQSPNDFARVCRGAGLAPDAVVNRLRRMQETTARKPVFQFPFQQAA